MSRAGPALLRVVAGLRAAWDILGATLLLLALVLICVAGVRGLTRPAGRGGPPHPHASEPWYSDWSAEEAATQRMRWTAYTHWRRRPFAGRWVNVDSAGLRVTPQKATDRAPRAVWFFGGSTMWGTGQRDSATIPAVVARALDSIGVRDVRVTNFGETGYVSTQELVRLLLALRSADRAPDVVVFYDGINDAAASAMNRQCGLPQNEGRRSVEFAIGRFLTVRGGSELRDMLAAMADQSRRSNGVHPLTELRETPELRAMGHGIVDCYARNARIIEALGKQFGFQALYVWQPTPSVSPKPLTDFERQAIDSTVMDGLRPYLWILNRVSAREIDSAMAPIAGPRFLDLSRVFTGDSGAVWLDFVGHLTERANAVVAHSMVAPIASLITADRSR